MAAIQPARPAHARHPPSSDPFSDPLYSVPHLRAAARTAQAPPPPPKSAKKHKPPAARTASPARNTNMASGGVATRAPPPPPTDAGPRTRMHRSQTAVPAQDVETRPQTHSRRSHSQDSLTRAAAVLERSKSKGHRTGGAKKGSVHADVIDRMDLSAVGTMFHHDGPFDACAPSRNRYRTKAPMLAWGTGAKPDEQAAISGAGLGAVGGYDNYSPYPNARGGKNAYTTPIIPYEPPPKKHDALAEAWGIHEPEPYEEFFAGGGGGNSRPSSTYNSRGATPISANHASQGRRSKEGTRDMRELYREHLDDGQARQPQPAQQQQAQAQDAPGARRTREKRSTLPPPQPIFVPDAREAVPMGESPPSPTAGGYASSPGAPRRSKSLMQRIRKMRENPNMPAGAAYDAPESDSGPSSAPANRPTHRPQRSFLGRIGTGNGGGAQATRMDRSASMSPTTEKNGDAFVYVDDPKNKELPAAPYRDYNNGQATTPRSPGDHGASGGYFDESNGSGGYATTPGGSIARKGSLLRRARGLVRGTK